MSSTITNPRRIKQIREFWDIDRNVSGRYYDLLDRNLSRRKLKEEMQGLIQEDPDFYDTYIIVADILEDEGKAEEARKLLYTAYERAVLRIVDKEGNFPKRIEWGWLDNRHLVRAIDRWARELWEDGKTEEALDIFREVLHSNLNDNIGARHDILAIRLGLGPNYEQKFVAKGMDGYLDAFKLSEWFHEHSKEFPDEFGWWFKAVEKDG